MVINNWFETKPSRPYGLEILQEKRIRNNFASFIGDILFGSPSSRCSGHGICEIPKYRTKVQYD